ncbi:MAG: carboxypeptidase regulatory-like domain-containing protein [Terracidiphilus sp.]
MDERADGKLATRPSPWRLAMLTLCAALLLAASLAPAQQLQPDAQNVPASVLTLVHGVVRNAVTGEPLPRALVLIEGDSAIGALTDGEGRFELPGVPVGPHIIRVRKPGFNDRPYATEDVGYQGDGPAHSVLVAAEMPDLAFALTPTSAIHGRIELSTGDPAQGIELTLLKQVVSNGRAVWAQNGVTKTNGDGAYRFAGLPAGVYALFTKPTLESEPAATAVAAGAKVVRNGYPTIFYPEAREFSGAARIRLAAGQQSEANLLLPLEPFYTVTATPILPNGKPFEGKGLEQDFFSSGPVLAAAVLDTADRQLDYSVPLDQATHSVQAILPNGTYTLLAIAIIRKSSGPDPPVGPGGLSQAQESFIGFTELSVDGHTVSNLRIPLIATPGWPIHLRAMRTNAQPVQSSANASQGLQKLVTVRATDADLVPLNGSGDDITAVDTGPDLLEMNGVGPGPHWISTQLNDRSLCVDSFSAGGVNLAREPLNVPLGASPPPMELTLRDDCARLALTLPPMLAAFLPGDEPFYTVYVVPDFDTTADIPPMTVHPSSGATLNVDGLTPGSYHVYVFDRPVRLEYRNPAVLAALPTPGQQVTLSPGSTANLMLEIPGQ